MERVEAKKHVCRNSSIYRHLQVSEAVISHFRAAAYGTEGVIRVGAGYFERDSGFFLIGSGTSGADLRQLTEARIRLALSGLRHDSGLDDL